MKPIAFFFTQWVDYSLLIEQQSKISLPSVYQPKKR